MNSSYLAKVLGQGLQLYTTTNSGQAIDDLFVGDSEELPGKKLHQAERMEFIDGVQQQQCVMLLS